MGRQSTQGFTIIELLIVVIIIGILVAITAVAYAGVQKSAQEAKIQSDLKHIQEAVSSIHIKTAQPLWSVTNRVTADGCSVKANGTDFESLPKTDNCWVHYNDTLDKISDASGMDVRGLLDPWGRPYFIYENEGRETPTTCTNDFIAVFRRPHVQWAADYRQDIPNVLPNC